MAGWFTSRINASVVPAAPAAAPLGIGETVSALGRTAGAMADQQRQTDLQVSRIDLAIAEREKAAAQDRANSALAVNLAKSEGDYQRWVIDHQNDADFDTQAAAKADADIAALRGTLGNDEELLTHWEPVLAQSAERRKTAAYTHVATVRAKASAMAAQESLSLSMDNAAAQPARTEEFAAAEETRVLGDSTIPADLRPVMARARAGQIRLAGLSAAASGGAYEAVAKEIAAGTYIGKLPEGGIEALQKVIEAQRGAADVAARAAEAERQKAAREAIAQVTVAIDNGDVVPVTTINSVLANAKAAGLQPSELMKAGYLAGNMVHTQAAKAMDTGTLETRIGALRARQAAGGEQALKPEEGRMLDQYQKEMKARDETAGARLGPLLKGGIDGRAQGVAQLAAMNPERRFAAAEAAGDRQAAVIAGLHPLAQRAAIEGAVMRRERPDVFKPQGLKDKEADDEIERVVMAKLGGVADHDGGAYKEIRDTALDIMAATGHKYDERNLKAAIDKIYGSSIRDGKRYGGVQTVMGMQVVIPPYLTVEQFAQRYARHDFAGAVLANGQPASAADIKAHYQLRQLDPNPDGTERYSLIGPDFKALGRRRRDGRIEPYVLEVPKVAP